MVTAGIDMGAWFVKTVILSDGKVIGRSMVSTGFEPLEAAKKGLDQAIKQAGIKREEISTIVSTGAGRKSVDFADKNVTEVTADARGTVRVLPSTRTIVDIGAEEARGISCDASGKVLDFAKNDKCAAAQAPLWKAWPGRSR